MILSPSPKLAFLDNNGRPLVGGLVFTYAAGTTTKVATYRDSAGTLNTNPIVLDYRGECDIWLDPTLTYKYTLAPPGDTDPPTKPIWTVDNISPLGGLTQIIIGQILFPQTAAEFAAGVLPTRYYIPSHDAIGGAMLSRYGADTSGATSSNTAFASALAVSNTSANGIKILGGGPNCTYRIDSTVAMTGSLDFDGQGCTIKPNGNTGVFTRNSQTPTATTTVSSGATIGSRSFVVASATGIVVGQWCRVVSNDEPTNDTNAFPSHWSKVTSIAGTTIEIDLCFRITQQGTITAEFYNTSIILPVLHVRDVRFDGSLDTNDTATGQAIRAFHYEDVDIDCEFINFDNNGTLTCALEIAQCIDARARVRVVDYVSKFHLIDIQDCRTAHLRDSIAIGGGFGMTITRCEEASMWGNSLQGHYKMEVDLDATSTSVRGLKMYGVGSAKILHNDIQDYESPIKVECCHQFDVSHNSIRNGSRSFDQVAINVSNQVDGDITTNGMVTHNLVINSGGVGIGVTSSTTPSLEGRCIIVGNQIKGAGSHGIYCLAPNSIISDNRVQDWSTTSAGTYNGIFVNDGATCIGNRFRNTDATAACFNIDASAGFKYVFQGTTCETANPIFTGSLLTDNRGQSTINNGTTSRVITHLMVTTPEITDIYITPTTNPTNDPGIFYVDTITSTQFTVRCRADPGASNWGFGWRVALRMPYTS